MSFILDALRKSEHERQRSSMPGIAQVPFGLPRREIPRWAIGVIAVLALAVLALGGAWWSSTGRNSDANPEPSVAARSGIPLVLPPAAVATPPAQTYSAPRLPERAAEPSEPSRRSAEPAASNDRTDAPVAASRNEARGAEPDAAAETPDTLTLPSAAALAAQGVNLPPLRLELHAYSPRPAERFVFINGTKYAEGATLSEGPRLVSIAPDGAVLLYLSHRFLLPKQ